MQLRYEPFFFIHSFINNYALGTHVTESFATQCDPPPSFYSRTNGYAVPNEYPLLEVYMWAMGYSTNARSAFPLRPMFRMSRGHVLHAIGIGGAPHVYPPHLQQTEKTTWSIFFRMEGKKIGDRWWVGHNTSPTNEATCWEFEWRDKMLTWEISRVDMHQLFDGNWSMVDAHAEWDVRAV